MKKSIALNGFLNVVQKCATIIFPLITMPYLLRILGASNYGKFSFTHSIMVYFLLFSMLGINTYAIREASAIKDDKKMLDVFAAEVTSINLFSTILCCVILAIIINMMPMSNDIKLLLFIQGFIMPCTFVGREWINIVFEDYAYTTIRYLVIQLFGIILIFLFVTNTDDYIIYAIIYTITASLGYIINLFYLKKYIPFKITKVPSLKKHLIPILILFASQLAATIYIESDITMLGFFRTEIEVGQYSAVAKVYSLVKSVNNAITAVVIPRITYMLSIAKQKEAKQLLSKIANTLMALIIPISIGIIFLSEDILFILGGIEYLNGNKALEVLALTLPIAVFSGFYCNAILVPAKKEKQFMLITIISATVNCILNLFLLPQLGMLGAAVTTFIAEVIVLSISVLKANKVVLININLRDIFAVVLGTNVVGGICYLSNMFIDDRIYKVLFCIIVSAILYMCILIVCRHSLVIFFGKQVFFINRRKRK